MSNTSRENQKSQSYGSFVRRIPSPIGRPRTIESPEVLWNKFVDYVDEIDSNPWQVRDASNSMSDGSSKANNMRQNVQVRQRAYTLHGFCAFCGIFSKWADWKRNNIDRDGFKEVIFAIENVICAQQLDGALINQFDSSLVARLNNIADSYSAEVTGDVFQFPKLSKDDINELKALNGL